MMPEIQTQTTNSMIIEASIDKVWWHLSTSDGWNSFLSDIATSNKDRQEILVGDTITLVIGELTYKAQCQERIEFRYISFDDHYKAILPNGSIWEYSLKTSFSLSPYHHMTKVRVTVDGYSPEEMMQWVRECGEVGWRQSLFNLKCILELGLDLRNEIFNYPRLGVFNYTATAKQLEENGLKNLRGNYLKKVYPNGPAALAGLKDGDIVTHIDEENVPTYYDFVRVLSKHYNKKSKSKVKYIRNRQSYTAEVLLTYDDQFTGMIDPKEKSLEEVSAERKKNSK